MSKPSNTTIMNAHNLDYMATYENLRSSKSIGSLTTSEKGLITCKVRNPAVSVQISNRGKVNIYYGSYKDLQEVTELLKELIVCDNISIVSDIPRKLAAVEEGIKANLAKLIEPDLSRQFWLKYISSTTNPKTYMALIEGLDNFFKVLMETKEYNAAVEEFENTTEWIVTFGTEVNVDNTDYVKECDRLTEEISSTLKESPYDFRLYEDHRDGEGLSLRYVFKWCPVDGPLDAPPYPDRWELLELEPFSEIYHDSDPSDMYEI